MLRHDFTEGIVKRSAQLLVPIGLFLLIVWMNQATFQRIDMEFGKKATLGMYLFYLFAGCLPAGVSGNDFSLPMGWLLIEIGCLFCTVTYPTQDLESAYGIQVLVRGQSRIRWWLTKCLWNMETVFLYYSTLFITAVVYCVCSGASCSLELEYSDLIHLLADASMTQPSVSGAETAAYVLGLPTAATAAISLWQMLVSILWHPAYGFTAGIVLLVWSAFLDDHTGLVNLRLIAKLRGTASEAELCTALERVGLDPADKRRVRKYSLGMKQRLAIAMAIAEKPKLILLDEPTNALDAEGLSTLKDIIVQERDRGALVILASHDAEFLHAVTDRIFPMEFGRFVDLPRPCADTFACRLRGRRKRARHRRSGDR